MKGSHILLALSFLLLMATVLPATANAQAFPRIVSVTPDTGQAGDQLTAEGENLDQGKIGDLYLTDGQKDYKTEIVEQTATSIRFTIPSTIGAGRFNLMVLTKEEQPRLIEQPVKVEVQ
jgi:hypothetical protein